MKYRYKKNQLFRKKLDMPERILNKIYNKTLSYHEYIEYDLEDKVPIDCLSEVHRHVVERFGLARCKDLDWELIDSKGFSLLETIKDIDPEIEDINSELYRFVIDDMRPKDYTKMMKNVYSNLVLEDKDVPENLRNDFNSGYLKITDIVRLWDYVKEKDLSLCLKNDYYNNDHITDEELKKFMNEYSGLLSVLDNPSEIYNMIINAYRSKKPIDERNAYIKMVVDKILDKTINDGWNVINLTNEQYHVIFRYTSVRDYLYKKLGDTRTNRLLNEIHGKDPAYLLDIVIPFNVLIDEGVLTCIEIYGLDNFINFDNECGHYFTNNDCEALKNMYDMYVKYANNEDDKEKSIFTKRALTEKGVPTDRPYTKDEFYEAIRRMIVYGPTDWNYNEKTTGYRCITGEFREFNQELFVDEKAPENFQDAFYTKTLTPIFLRDNYNCISYLIGKKLSTTFSPLSVRVSKLDNGYYKYENVYKFLEEKLGFEETIKIVTDYADVFEVLFSSYDKLGKGSAIAAIQFDGSDTKDVIVDKINDKLYELIIKGNIKYSSNLSKTMKEKYPNVFIVNKAPKELQTLFYNREIDGDYILHNPDDKKYFEGLDIELFFKYMPVTIIGNCETIDDDIILSAQLLKRTENLISCIKNIFGNDEGLALLLSYGKYLDEINEKIDFNKVEIKEDITEDDFLNQLDCLLYLNIIKGELLYCEKMPEHFKNSYPHLFLLDNAPVDVKNKFYSRTFTLEDFYSNGDLLKYFANTDIASGLDTTFSYMIGLFESSDFLKVIKLAGESIKSDSKFFNYLRSKTSSIVTLEQLSIVLYEYFKQADESLRYLMILNKLGYENEDTKQLNAMFDNLIMIRPELDVNNPCLCGKLFNNITIEKYGYDVLLKLLEYNSGAHKVIINAVENNDLLLEQWINYVKKLPIYTEEILHYTLIAYEHSKVLINNLIENNIILNSVQLQNLKKLLNQKNKYNVQTLEDLTNYDKHQKFVSEEKISIGNPNTVRDGIMENIFGVSLREMTRIFKSYGLYSKEYVNKYLKEVGAINSEDEKILNDIRDIYTLDGADTLKKKFKDLKSVYPSVVDVLNIENKIKLYYSRQLKENLFHLDENIKDGIQRSSIAGLDKFSLKDINGNPMTSQTKINVIEFEGIPFKLLVHAVTNVESSFKDLNSQLINDPTVWNKLGKNHPILTNMITDQHLGCIEYGDKKTVYYGFNNLSENSLMLMGKCDIEIEHTGANLISTAATNEFMLPDILPMASTSYNVVMLNRASSDSSKYNHYLQPNFIICFDGYISEASRRAAQYFNIPIYMINRRKYRENNKLMIDKYQNDEIRKFTKDDVYNILYCNELDLNKRYDLFLRLSDKAYNNRIIVKEEYLSLLEEGENIMLKYSAQNDISNIDLDYIKERLDDVDSNYIDKSEES